MSFRAPSEESVSLSLECRIPRPRLGMTLRLVPLENVPARVNGAWVALHPPQHQDRIDIPGDRDERQIGEDLLHQVPVQTVLFTRVDRDAPAVDQLVHPRIEIGGWVAS